MSECRAPWKGWRKSVPMHSDEEVAHNLKWAWVQHRDMGKGPPYGKLHHDWTGVRALLLREARKRGLPIDCTGLA